MKKRAFLLVLMAVLAVSLIAVGCGDKEVVTTTAPAQPTTTEAGQPTTTEAGQPTTTEAAPQETIKLTFSDHNPPGNAAGESLMTYANYIEEKSGGRVKIDVQRGGALYGNTEIFDGLRTRGADAGTYVIDTGDGFYYANIAALPFMGYPRGQRGAIDAFWALYDEFPQIADEFAAVGLHWGALYAMPPAHIHWHNKDVVVTTPEDLKGKTLLTLEGYVANWFNVLGASTENPTFQDLFSMIDTRVADGFIQHFNFVGGFDLLGDFQSHTLFGDSGVLMSDLGVAWNKESWDSLPADIQQIAIDARGPYLDTMFEITAADAEIFGSIVKEQNHTVTVLTPEQIKPWRDKLAPVYAEWIAKSPDPAVGQQMFDRLVELAAK